MQNRLLDLQVDQWCAPDRVTNHSAIRKRQLFIKATEYMYVTWDEILRNV